MTSSAVSREVRPEAGRRRGSRASRPQRKRAPAPVPAAAGSQGGSVAAGMQNVCYIIALIAVNLAIMNLLPLPALDGGRIFMLIVGEVWQLLSGRRLDPKYEAWIHGAGFALLLLLMVVVTFSDIWKLVT